MECGVAEDRIYLYGPQDVVALANCSSFRGSLEFTNTRLREVDGLTNLRSVGGDLNFFRNWDLASLRGLWGLVNVGGNLMIHLDDSLETMDGLQQLRSVGGLAIHSNAILRSLEALQGLETVAGDLVITGNPRLPQVDAEGFAARLLIGGTTTVAENMP
jgi:hypothetical protein